MQPLGTPGNGGSIPTQRSRAVRRFRSKLLAAAGAAAILGFLTPALAQHPACPNPPLDPSRSIVVTDAALDRERFSFRATIDAILKSLNVNDPTDADRENFLRTMIASFNAQQFNNPDSGLPMPVDVRRLEAALDPKKLLDPGDATGLVPIALFNRFELVPDNLSNCGEHRIVYSFKAPISNGSPIPSRFFLIFEARLENAEPGQTREQAFEGCRPIAEFWRNLSDIESSTERANRLVEFYYSGIPGAIRPVVHARNFGGPLGQVRGNIFMNEPGTPPKWQLREWIVINAGGTTPASFLPVTVKTNPLAEFYQDANPGSLDPVLEAIERGSFQKEFTRRHIEELLDHERVVTVIPPTDKENYDARLDVNSGEFDEEWYRIVLLNNVGARFDNRFNEFQGVSQGDEDNPRALIQQNGTLFLDSATSALNGIQVQEDRKPDINEVMERAGAITCGGCHGFSEQRDVGALPHRKGEPRRAIKWPADRGFVHVTEPGASGMPLLSEALETAFIPFRADALKQAVCEPAIEAQVAALPSAAAASAAAEQNEFEQLVEQLQSPQATRTEAARAELTARLVAETLELREDEFQLPGFFVTNRRPH